MRKNNLPYLVALLHYLSNCLIGFLGSIWWSKKYSTESSQCTEEEEVPMPVQEVCGYKEWQKEV